MNCILKITFFIVLFAFTLLASPISVGSEGMFVIDDKISMELFLSKHLASIGNEDARTKLKSITAIGTAKAHFKGRGEGRAEGIAVIASQAEKNLIGMKFNNPDYPYEKLAFDGKNFTVGFVRPGEYTVLGQFLRVNEKTFKSGIIGGTMSTAWDLLNYDANGGKLKARGMTKVDGVEVLKFDYSPKIGSDLNITLFFDPVTFRHVRTEYRRVIAAAQGLTVDTSSRQSETRYKMVEEFSDFKETGNLTLPHAYRLHLELLTGNGTTSYTWEIAVQSYSMNQQLAETEFKVDIE